MVLGSLPSGESLLLGGRYFLDLPEAILTLLSGDCYSRGGEGGSFLSEVYGIFFGLFS